MASGRCSRSRSARPARPAWWWGRSTSTGTAPDRFPSGTAPTDSASRSTRITFLARTPQPCPPEDVRFLKALAGTATTSVLTGSCGPLRSYDIVTRTQAALSAKRVLDIASGMLAATVRITPAEGGQRLRTYAAIHRQRPADVAPHSSTLTKHPVVCPAG